MLSVLPPSLQRTVYLFTLHTREAKAQVTAVTEESGAATGVRMDHRVSGEWPGSALTVC